MNKMAFIVGHNSLARGAVRIDTDETEYEFNSRLALLIEELAPAYGIEARIFHRIPVGSVRRELDQVYEQVDAWGALAAAELHFNSHDSRAHGSEVLSSGTALSLRLAANVQREIVAALGLKDRGVKTVGAGKRGGMSLHSGKCPAILIEPFFGSSEKDLSHMMQRGGPRAIAHALLRGAREAMASFPRKDITESRTMKAAQAQRKAQTRAAQSVCGIGVVQIAQTVTGGAQTPAQAIEAVRPLMEFAPHLSGLLAGFAIAMLVVSFMKTKEIEAARVDDFGREIR